MADLLLTTLRAENATTLSTMMLPKNCSKPFPTMRACWYIIIRYPPSCTLITVNFQLYLPSVLSRCWLCDRKDIQPVKTEWWGTGMVTCLQWGANDLHMVQLMHCHRIISCSSKIQNRLPFWCQLNQVILEKAVKNGCSSSSSSSTFLGDRLQNGSPYAIGPLSVCLPVTFVHSGQTVGRIKMKLGMQIGLGHGHIVLSGDPAPPPLKGHSPPKNFRPISVAAK